MVDRRLLKLGIGGVLTIALVAGVWNYMTSPIVAPAFEGRVVDAKSHQPIAGVHIFVVYELTVSPVGAMLSMGGSTGRATGFQKAMTKDDGRFRFERMQLSPWDRLGWRYKRPFLQWFHKEYGWGAFFRSSSADGDYEISRDAEAVRRIRAGEAAAVEEACELASEPRTCRDIVRGDLTTDPGQAQR